MIIPDRLISRLLFVRKLFGENKRLHFLDYGAGFGKVSILAQALEYDVTALEFSEERKQYLQEKGIATIHSGQVQKDKFHFAYMASVLEHVTDPFSLLTELRNYLMKDGILFIGVPDCKKLKKHLTDINSCSIPEPQEKLLLCSALQHVNCFTHKSLLILADRAGFSPLKKPYAFLSSMIFRSLPIGTFKSIVYPFYLPTSER